MVSIGGIVSVGGTGGGGGGAGSSGIQNLNGQTGPVITLVGTSGIIISPVAANIINIGFNGSLTQSGVIGVNGIDVDQVTGEFVVNGAALSGLITAHDGSGINAINGDTGPNIDLIGVSGIQITPLGNGLVLIGTSGAFLTTQSGVLGVNGIDVEQVDGNFIVDGAALSGLITPSGGIGSINGQIGPVIEITGVNGVTVTVSAENELLIDGAGASGVSGGGGGSTSGLCFTESFTAVTSTTVTHNLGTTDVVVDIFDASNNKLFADRVGIVDLNNVILEFNTPQTGKVVILGCGGTNTNTEECRRYALLVS